MVSGENCDGNGVGKVVEGNANNNNGLGGDTKCDDEVVWGGGVKHVRGNVCWVGGGWLA